jgi:hypothetical protein
MRKPRAERGTIASKDVIVALPDGRVLPGFYNYKEKSWYGEDIYDDIQPTHWMPFPNPPR